MPNALRLAFMLVLLLTALARADEAPQARAYFDWIFKAVDRIDADMPDITKAAELTADKLIEGRNLGVRGGVGLNEELGARAGGIVIYRATAGEPGDAIFYAFGVATKSEPDVAKLLDKELTDAEALTAKGSVVIGVASLEQLREHKMLERAQKACAVLLDNHAPGSDGLFAGEKSAKPRATEDEAQTRAVIPTFTVANPIVGWAWTAEVFAACSRKGKTLAMYKSVMVDPGRQRYEKYKGVRFHDDISVEPIEAGKLGHQYIKELRGLLLDVSTASWPALERAADAVAGTKMDGGKVWLYAMGHYVPYHAAGQLAADPGLYTPLSFAAGSAEPDMGDYALAIGYAWPPEGLYDNRPVWEKPDVIRRAGRGVAWVISGYLTRGSDLAFDEVLVDQQWAEGDALVTVPGYDVRICPGSGVVAEAMLWAITAEARQRVMEQEAATVR